MYKSKKYKIVKIYEKDYNNVNNKNNYDSLFLLNNAKITNNQNEKLKAAGCGEPPSWYGA